MSTISQKPGVPQNFGKTRTPHCWTNQSPLFMWASSQIFSQLIRHPSNAVIPYGYFSPIRRPGHDCTTEYSSVYSYATFSTSYYRQIWHPEKPISLIVWSIVEGVNENNIIVNKCLCSWLDRQLKGRLQLVMFWSFVYFLARFAATATVKIKLFCPYWLLSTK